MMRHGKIEKLLAVYRSLDVAERRLVDDHVRSCPSCAARLASYEEMDRRLAALPTPAPDRRLRTIVAAALAGYAGATVQPPGGHRLSLQALPLLAALVLVLALGIAAVFMARGFVRTPSVEPQIVQPVLEPTSVASATLPVSPTVDASALIVPAEMEALVGDVLQHELEGAGPGGSDPMITPTIHRFRQIDDWAVVDVSYSTAYEALDRPALSERQVIAFQRGPGGIWQPSELIYMPENILRELWGHEKALNLRTLDLVYYEFDEPFVRSALAEFDLDAFVERTAANLQRPLDAGPRLSLTIAPDRSALWQDEAPLQVDGLSDVPLGDLVPTATSGFAAPLVPVPNVSELSLVFGSTDLDVGLTIFSRLRRATFLELARRAAGETMQPAGDFPALISQIAIWEAGPPAYRVGPDLSMVTWASLPAELRQLPPLSELLAPQDTVDDAFLAHTMPYVKAMVFLAFVEEQYGKQAFGPLVRALVGQDTWEDVVRAVFNENPAQFEEQWQQWVASKVASITLYPTPAPVATPYPTPAPSATPTPLAAPGIVERDAVAATALALLPPLPSVTYPPDFATQEAVYAEMLATQTAQATLTPSPPATATPTSMAPPPEPRSLSGLVYRTVDGLWLVGADGKARFLSDQPYGALSPDGAQMVTSDDGDIWLADLTTSERRNLTEQQDGVAIVPQWWPARPDAVIFGSHRSGDYASFGFLTAVGTDGRGYELLDGQEGSFEKPALGRDGQTIAYDRGGKPYLYRWGAGPEPIDLSRFSGTDLAGLRMANPAWSPDGNKLAWFVYGELDQGNTVALAVLDLARQEARLLHPYRIRAMGGFPPAPTWSPDGQWLAFSSADEDPSQDGVWVVRASGSEERYLGNGAHPTWDPDGNRLAFSRFDAASRSRIVISDAVTWAVAELAEPKDGTVADWIRLDQVE